MTAKTRAKFTDKETWLTARKKLLEKEKAFTRARDELAKARRELPFARVEKPYLFATERGEETLPDLFKGKSQLIVYHFMFGIDWKEGCPSCSFWMDNLNGIDPHLAARDISFVAVSLAPLDKLLAYKKRMGWRHNWVSSGDSDFNIDFGVTFPGGVAGKNGGYNYSNNVYRDELPGVSVFRKFEEGSIGHFYSTFARGLDILNGAYNLIDLTPNGRNEEDLEYTMAWVRRRDQYT